MDRAEAMSRLMPAGAARVPRAAPAAAQDSPAAGPQALHDEREHALAVAAAVPGLLGFRPTRSLVMVGQGHDRQVLVPDYAEDAARHAAAILRDEQVAMATVLAFGSEALASGAGRDRGPAAGQGRAARGGNC